MCTGFEIAVLGLGTVAALGSVAQGQQQKKLMDYNARVAENEGIAARQAAEYEETRQRRESERFKSTMRARIAGSGVVAEGSPLLALAETAEQSELDALTIRRSGTAAAARANAQAAADRYTGRMYQTAGYFGAGTALLKGATQIYDSRRSLPGTTQPPAPPQPAPGPPRPR